MQSEEYHNNHGRGRNISCNNYDCLNFRKKFHRIRGRNNCGRYICPICHKEGFEHSYSCTVSKGNKMNCNSHLLEIVKVKW